MMAARKTMDVDRLRFNVNYMLKHDVDHGENYRMGAASLLEHVLHTTGNYRGYRYLDASEVPDGELPGIDRSDQVVDEHHVAQNVRFPDESRRHYH